MGKFERKTFLTVTAIVIFLFAVFAVVQALQPTTQEPFRVSILLDGPDDELWNGFHLGVEHASVLYNIEYRFCAQNEFDSAQQLATLEREIDSGADALILAPIDAAKLSGWLDSRHVSIPIITIGAPLPGKSATLYVGANNVLIGQTIAREVLSLPLQHLDIYVLADQNANADIAQRYEGLSSVFSENNIAFSTLMQPVTEELITFLLSSSTNKSLFIGLRERDVLSLCSFSTLLNQIEIIGYGYSNSILSYLQNNGSISKLIIQSQFDLGYLSLERAYLSLQKQWPSDCALDLFVVNQENMYSDPFEHILYPVS